MAGNSHNNTGDKKYHTLDKKNMKTSTK